MNAQETQPVKDTQATKEATDKLKDLYKRKSQSTKEMFKSMQGYLSEYISDKTEDQKPVWDLVKESIKTDGVSNIPRNMTLLFKTYKFGPLSGFKRQYVVILLDLIISSLIFGAINGFFYSGLRTLFGLCAPFVTTLLLMIILYVPLTGLVNNLIALFRSYYFLHYNIDEEHHLIDELRVANNKLLKRIDPYYRLDPYNIDDSVIVVGDKNAKKKTISEEYRGYLDYEEDDLLEPPVTKDEKVGDDALAWGHKYVSDNKDKEEIRAKNIAPDVNPLDWARGYISENKEHPDKVEVRDAAILTSKTPYEPKDAEDLEVLSLMSDMKGGNTLDSALENIKSDFDSDSDKEIFEGIDLEELQSIKDSNPAGEHTLRDKLYDSHQLKIRKDLKQKEIDNPSDPMAVEKFKTFM